MELGAIQVLRRVDKRKKIDGKIIEVKEICTVEKYENGPSLEEIFLQDDVKCLPILGFAIAGMKREGKSFLLNLMIKHLEFLERDNEHLDEEGWMSGKVPNCFRWINGSESVTRGLWIYPKVFRLKNGLGNKVGVMLLDIEGLGDANATDGEMAALCGISAFITCLQIFNMKHFFTTYGVEGVVRTLMKGINEMNSIGKQNIRDNYKLMFVVRDWKDTNRFPYGLTGGRICLENEENGGTEQNKGLWRVVRQVFRDVECVLLPSPGEIVEEDQFCTTGDLSMLKEEFLSNVKVFIESLFKSDNLVPPERPLTGKDIHDIFMSANGRKADDKSSFLNTQTELENINNVEVWLSDYGRTLENVVFSELIERRSEISNILQQAKIILAGESKSKYMDKLTKGLQGSFNNKVVERLFQQYRGSFQEFASVEKQQSAIWPDVYKKVQNLLCGDNATKQSANHKFVKKSAANYYCLLREEHHRSFETNCSSKKTLEECVELDEKDIELFKECQDFNNDTNKNDVSHAIWLKEYHSLKNEIVKILLKKISELTGIATDTLKRLREQQYKHFESLTLLNEEWDTIKRDDKLSVAKKVGYAMFGLPAHLETTLLQTTTTKDVSTICTETGYSKDQECKIWPIVEKIFQVSTGMSEECFSCIFLCFVSENQIINLPLFRINTKKGIYYFDSNCRRYKGWDDVSISIKLPEVVYCYPLNGSYSKKKGFRVAFAEAPTEATVLKATDTIGNCVTVGAGGVAIAAAVGVAAPVVAVGGMAAGALAGVYGVVRGMKKIKDKREHDEPIKFKDVINLLANITSVVGGGKMAYAGNLITEGALMILVKATPVVSFFTAFCTSFDNTSELIGLISQIQENRIKTLFYLNAPCLETALEAIRKKFKLENNINTYDTLMALIEGNCTQAAAEPDTGDLRVVNYVSQNIVSLVTGILKDISSDVQEIVSHFCILERVCQEFSRKVILKELMANQIQEKMCFLMEKLRKEIETSKERFSDVLVCNSNIFSDDSVYTGKLISEVIKVNGLPLAFMFLRYSLMSVVRKANTFFNSIEHNAIHLNVHHFDDILFHPLYEIRQKIMEAVEQTESSKNLESYTSTEFKDFILMILMVLQQKSSESWSADQYARCLKKITEDVVTCAGEVIKQHERFVEERGTITCKDLDELSRQLGVKEYNYGMNVLKKVFSEKKEVGSAVTSINVGPDASRIFTIPVWNGILDNIFFYYSESRVENKLDLIKFLETSEMTYEVQNSQNNICLLIPSDKDICPTFVVYTELKCDNESGLILLMKEILHGEGK